MAYDVQSNNFEEMVLNSSKPVVVDFWAPWCGPCRMMSPVIDSLEERRSDVSFVKINIDEETAIATSHHIQSIPTFVIYKEGKIIAKKMGGASEDDFMSWIDKSLA